jgi:phosphoribosylamine--glycine ligase
MFKVATIGKDGRTEAITQSLSSSAQVFSLSDWKSVSPEEAMKTVLKRASEERPDFVVVGPEEPLNDGVVDRLADLGVPCVGPTKALARLESSKSFTRDLLSEYKIPGNPDYKVFQSCSGIEAYLRSLDGFVVKPDGLTGGKGVKIYNEHLFSIEESVRYCAELFQHHPAVVIEEKLEGEEFSLMSFCDGRTVKDMVVVQDHKRVGEGDTGPNTGGMGSYSCEDHSLPFLSKGHVDEASRINKMVAKALLSKTNQPYKGILYGGFMVTRQGLRLLEYNARFGDPETLNVLPILKTDFAEICWAIVKGTLDKMHIVFENRATVCKYVVPDGYPDKPVRSARIDLSAVPLESENLKIYRAAVDKKPDGLYLTGSRGIAFVGIGRNVEEAEAIAEKAAASVKGPVFHRRDIGTHALIQQRVGHINELTKRSGGGRRKVAH